MRTRLFTSMFSGTRAVALVAAGAMSFATFEAAQAATATANLSVSANIAGACSVGGAALSFGPYSSTAAATTSSTIAITCSAGTAAVVTLSQGANNNKVPSAGTRALNNGTTNFLGYNIYTDSAFSTLWNGTNSLPVNSTGSAVNLTAYGRIPAGQSPASGSYNDTVVITATF